MKMKTRNVYTLPLQLQTLWIDTLPSNVPISFPETMSVTTIRKDKVDDGESTGLINQQCSNTKIDEPIEPNGTLTCTKSSSTSYLPIMYDM